MYRFASPDKRRPVLVISREDAIRVLSTVMVAPVTTTIHGLLLDTGCTLAMQSGNLTVTNSAAVSGCASRCS